MIERLICVQGFDVGLDDVERFAMVRSWVQQVADSVGVRAVFVKTNLRQHPRFDALSWGITHMAGLACVAHALAPVVSRAYVASSDTPAPWGSRPALDPLWSSNAVKIVNDGSESRKFAKLRAIADWPLVYRFLRVCYKNRTSSLNCGTCPKCVRTQLMFEIIGKRHRLQTFPQAPIVDLIDGTAWIAPDNLTLWTELMEHIRNPEIIAAIARLLKRRRPTVDRLQHETQWLRKTAGGRLVRRIGKRLLAL